MEHQEPDPFQPKQGPIVAGAADRGESIYFLELGSCVWLFVEDSIGVHIK